MDYKDLFSEEHEIFRKSVRQFVEKELAPHADKWEEEKGFPDEVFRKCGEMGLLGIEIPEEYGGAGAGFLTTAVMIEELARCRSGGVAAGIVLQACIALPPLAKLGTDEQKQKFLVPGVRGEKIGALGVTEPFAGSDVAGIRTTAVKDGDHYVINGSKIFITNGVRADFVLLAVKTDKDAGHQGISMIIVEKGTPGFSVGRKLEKVGWRASDTGELIFEDVRVPRSNMLGTEGAGFYQIMFGFQAERLVMALGAVAGAQLVLDAAVEYAKQREQFGQPICRFQVTAHRLVDMACMIESARQLTYHATWLFNRGEECAKELSMAKIMGCQVAHQVADMALQIHGGYGYMMEYDVQRAWRDTRLGPIGGGTSEIQKEIVGRLMGL